MQVDAWTAWYESQLPTALDWLRQMVEINSWTDNRDGVNKLSRLTATAFAPLGFTAGWEPCTNPAWGDHLTLTRMGTSPINLALVSHLDTVFPPEEEIRNQFHWSIEGDRIYGPGTHDIKGGTILIWMILGGLQQFQPTLFDQVTWRIFLNSAEELYSPDFGALCNRHLDNHTLAALVFEAEGRQGNVGRLVRARKGRSTWRLTARGRGAHAGGRHPHGANAVVQLATTIQQVASFTDYSDNLTFNPGKIQGGTGFNRVPHEAWLEGEFRAFDPEVFEAARNALLSLTGPGKIKSPQDGYTCNVEVDFLSDTRPWPANEPTDKLLARWQQAAKSVGIELEGEERGGISDGNYLWDKVPTLDGLGPAGDNDHCSERSPDGSKLPEYVDKSSFVPKAVINTLALTGLIQDALPAAY